MGLVSRYRVLAAAVIAGFGLCAAAVACNVPVFRFALERWRADAYQVTVLHREPLSEAQHELIRPLEQAQDRALANVVVQVVDASELEKQSAGASGSAAELRDQVLSRLEAGKPLLVVQYPSNLRIPKPVWTGPLTGEAVTQLTDSPVRQELVRRLAKGQTAVWLLLETGDPAKDGPAAALLEEELKKLEKSLELPELTAAPEDKLLSSAPLEISFSMIRVPRSAVEESALVAMLVGSEDDLAERNDPMVFPVFGRGRALLALIGPGITAKNIHDSAAFLVGPCSCEVKEQNPGFDLLLSVDWDDLLSEQGVSLTATQTRLTTPASSETELVPIPSGAPPPPATPLATAAPPTPVTIFKYPASIWLVVGGAGIVLVLLVGAIVVASQASRQG